MGPLPTPKLTQRVPPTVGYEFRVWVLAQISPGPRIPRVSREAIAQSLRKTKLVQDKRGLNTTVSSVVRHRPVSLVNVTEEYRPTAPSY